jgi:hypothetical protein
MIQDKYMPDFHFNEIHAIKINCSAARLRDTIDDLDFSGSQLIRFLFAVRGMPSRMMNWKGLEDGRFKRLELTNNELVIGLIGQFWKPSGNLQTFEPAEFNSFSQPGFLKAVWSFHLSETSGICTLQTETRIQCLGNDARKKFRVYWFFIRPFSGIIRMELLRVIRKKAEEAS